MRVRVEGGRGVALDGQGGKGDAPSRERFRHQDRRTGEQDAVAAFCAAAADGGQAGQGARSTEGRVSICEPRGVRRMDGEPEPEREVTRVLRILD